MFRGDFSPYWRGRGGNRRFARNPHYSFHPTGPIMRRNFNNYDPRAPTVPYPSFRGRGYGHRSKNSGYFKKLNKTGKLDAFEGKLPPNRTRGGLNTSAYLQAPYVGDYQVMGDSIFTYVGKYLGFNYTSLSPKSINFCSSGETSDGLLNKLKSESYKVADFCAVLIGCNDILHGVETSAVIKNLIDIARILSTKAQQVVFLTVLPIPRSADDEAKELMREKINYCICKILPHLGLDNVFARDMEVVFLDKKKQTIRIDYYLTLAKNSSTVPDMVHLSDRGIDQLIRAIREFEFPDAEDMDYDKMAVDRSEDKSL